MPMLVTVGEFLTMRGIDGNNLDPLVQSKYEILLRGADKATRDWLHWNVEQEVGRVDFYNGSGQQALVLRTPFTSPTNLSVRYDQAGYGGQAPNAFPAATLLTQGVDYMLDLDNKSLGIGGLLLKLPTANNWFWPSDATFYRQAGGLAFRKGPYWPVGNGNIKVTCTYGFAPYAVPMSIKTAIVQWVALLINTTRVAMWLTSETLGDYSYSGQIPPVGLHDMLRPYRDVSL